MILYNVTVKPDPEIAGAWLEWLQKEHIPDVMGTGCFEKATVLELMDAGETDGPTYAIQYAAKDRETLNHYLENFATGMRAKGTGKWGDRFIAFRTIMKVIN